MDRQTTLAFVLIGFILVIWLYFNSPQPTENQPKQTSELVEKEKSDVKESKIVKNSENSVKVETDSLTIKQNKERIITIESDLLKIELSTYGGNIHKYFLKNYNTWYFDDLPENTPWFKKFIQLINIDRGNELDLSFITKNGKLVETSKLEFQLANKPNYYKIDESDSLTLVFTFQFDETRSVQKIFKFYGNSYQSKFDVKFNKMSDYITGENYDITWNNGINFVELDATQEATYATGNAYTGGELFTAEIPSVGEKKQKTINGNIEWVGVKNKYFGFILDPIKDYNNGGAFFESEKLVNKYGEKVYNKISFKVPIKNLDNHTDSFHFFGGPLQYDMLTDYDKKYESMVDFGSFFGITLLIRPISEYFLLPLLTFLHSFIPNYGIVIIIFSLLIKIVLHPLTDKSFQSMKRMQLLQPEITAIKEKYANDQQRIQKETMALYSKYGVNPAGGCLPMLFQMPILFALFAFFKVVVELRQQPFFGWINNLSEPDVIVKLPFNIPFLGLDQISGLAVLLGVTMFLQQKMTMKDPSQKALVYIMPVMFTFMFMSFSSGLNLYYLMFNIFSITQQYWVNKTGIQKLEIVDPKKQKKGLMQKMMEAAEQSQKVRAAQTAKNKKR